MDVSNTSYTTPLTIGMRAMPKLGKTIKLLRTSAGMKQRDLAERLSISVNYLSLLENDRREPSISLVERMAKELGVSVSYMFWHAYEKPSDLSEDQGKLFDMMKDLLWRLQNPNVQNDQNQNKT